MESRSVCGFNYDGSWGSSGLDLWQHHDHGRMAVEVGRGKAYFPEWNTVRWWLSHEGYQRDPARFLENFDAGLGLFARHDIQVMPLLFNRWRDPVCDFGGVPLDHLIPQASAWSRADDLFAGVDVEGREPTLVETLFARYLGDVVGSHATDERVYAWDLCNEPLMGAYVHDPDSPIRAAELRWLDWCYRSCKALGARQPLTIGNHPETAAVRLTEPMSDVLSFHPYYMWNGSPGNGGAGHAAMATRSGFEKHLDDCVTIARAAGKELLASETVWGARDDAKHVEVMRYTLGQLAERDIGFLVHALHHSLVADLHRDEYGPVGHPECLHFIEADGSLRAGHEAFNEFAPHKA
jgi:hypothetical protein